MIRIPDEGRAMGIHVVASKGAGKSRLLGRVIAWLDFARETPLIVLDPNGGLIDNFLDKFTRLPPQEQDEAVKRIVYIDTAGIYDRIVPFPLYFKAGNESPYAIAQRYLDVVSALDPSLHRAPILGWNALSRMGTKLGMVIAACGLQITEAEDLLSDITPWEDRIQQALKSHREVARAVDFIKQMGELRRTKPKEYSYQADSFLTKISVFRLDPTMQAMFGASERGIKWEKVIKNRQAVLIDFRHEDDPVRRRFKLYWIFRDLMEFVRRRGLGRHRPLSVIIDEISYLLPSDEGDNPVLATQFRELIDRLSRNNQIWLSLAHQEMHQMSEPIQKALMTMGTQIIGSTTDSRAALNLASRFSPYDAYKVKKREPVYASYQGVSEVIDHRSVEFTKDEQREINSRRFLELPRYHFLVGVSLVEGTMPTNLERVSIEAIDVDQYVNEELVTKARKILARLSGRKVEDVLTEIEERKPLSPVPSAQQRLGRVARLSRTSPPER